MAPNSTASAAQTLASRGVKVEPGKLKRLVGERCALSAIEFEDGRLSPVEALYVAPQSCPSSPLAEQLGATIEEGLFGPLITTDADKMTSVPGLYAAGDIARAPHSVSWAVADGVTAGISAHRALGVRLSNGSAAALPRSGKDRRLCRGHPRRVPGLADLHRMTMLLLAEQAPETARHSRRWRRRRAGTEGVRRGAGEVALCRRGSIGRDAGPGWTRSGAFQDAGRATARLCRCCTRRTFRRRHLSADAAFPGEGRTAAYPAGDTPPPAARGAARGRPSQLSGGSNLLPWLVRSVAFADAPGAHFAQASVSAAAMAEHLPILSGDEDEALLTAAGFSNVALFYAGLSFRGWVATA